MHVHDVWVAHRNKSIEPRDEAHVEIARHGHFDNLGAGYEPCERLIRHAHEYVFHTVRSQATNQMANLARPTV